MVQSIKGNAVGQPPLVVFTLCLVIFGITMISLAYIIQDSDVPNPDVTMDWNIFLENFAALDVCMKMQQEKKMQKSSNALPHQLQPNASTFVAAQNESLLSSRTVNRAKSMSALLPDIMGTSIVGSKEKAAKNLTMSVQVPLKISSNISHWHWTRTELQGYVRGSFLGFAGKIAEQHVNVSLMFVMPQDKKKYKDLNDAVTVDACLTFRGSSLLLPQAKHPPSCSQHINNSWHIIIPVIMQPGPHVPNAYCQGGSIISLGYSPNPNLTVMLSNMDRSLANLHLMHTSYFVFIVAASFICFAVVRSRYYHNPKHGSPKKVMPEE